MEDEHSISDTSDAPVFGTEMRTFDYYWGVFRAPLLLALVLEVIFVVMHLADWTLWTVNIVFFLVVSWVVLRRKRDDFPEAGTAVVLSGVLIGLVVALAKLIVLQKVYLLFNLVAEPIRLAIVGLVISWIATLWFTRTSQRAPRRPVYR